MGLSSLGCSAECAFQESEQFLSLSLSCCQIRSLLRIFASPSSGDRSKFKFKFGNVVGIVSSKFILDISAAKEASVEL